MEEIKNSSIFSPIIGVPNELKNKRKNIIKYFPIYLKNF